MNAIQKQTIRPDYKKIYYDIIYSIAPGKLKECEKILNKKELVSIDIIKLDEIIFGHNGFNQKLKSYDIKTIYKILEYQRENQYTNIQIATLFKMSRNTVSKWKKMYGIPLVKRK